MRVLVTGAEGQLGSDIVDELKSRGMEAVGVDIGEMDVTDAQSVMTVIGQEKPEAVIHCAAYTAVDDAEDNEELCRRINAGGTENVAKACRHYDLPMMYISTDYVFNGEGMDPWEPDDPHREPINVYGQTKYEGELAVEENLEKYFIVRISWVFGMRGKNFVKTMLKLAETHDHLDVVADQIGSPTYTPDLAVLLVDMIQTDRYGRYHATNSGLCTWHEFATEIFLQQGIIMDLEPVTSEEYPTRAKRPHNSRMDKGKLLENGFNLLPPWQDALKRYLALLRS